MGISAEAKHTIHVIVFALWLITFEIICGAIPLFPRKDGDEALIRSPFEG